MTEPRRRHPMGEGFQIDSEVRDGVRRGPGDALDGPTDTTPRPPATSACTVTGEPTGRPAGR